MKLAHLAIVFMLPSIATIGCLRKPRSETTSSGIDPASQTNLAEKEGETQKNAKKRRGTFTIGKKTTYIAGPTDKDGHIDYVAALNEHLGKGVTSENNANVLIWKAVGPHPESATMPDRFFKLLGVPALPERGDYFIPLRVYISDHIKSNPAAVSNALGKLDPLARRTWTAAENLDIDGWLKANEKPLALILEATKRTHFYSPLVPPKTDRGPGSLFDTRLPVAQLSREIAAALATRAMLKAGLGEVDAAWQDLIACHKLGLLVARGGTLIEALVGCAIEQIAYRSDLAFLDHTKPDVKRIERYLRELRDLPAIQDVAAIVDRTDRYTHLDTIMLVDRDGLAALQGIGGAGNAGEGGTGDIDELVLDGVDWDPALEIANAWFDRFVAILKGKNRLERSRKLDGLIAELRAFKNKAHDKTRLSQLLKAGVEPGKAKGQAIGDVLITLLMPAVDKVQAGVDRAMQAQDNLSLAFALAWYHRDTGKYPDRLDTLAPKYLKEVPHDLFSGKPLIYRPAPNGYLLYSVGVNGRDDGGRGYDDQTPGDDLVVRMPVPPVR